MQRSQGALNLQSLLTCKASKFTLVFPIDQRFACWRTEMYVHLSLPFPHIQLSWQNIWGFQALWQSGTACMDILKSSVGILEKRLSAFGVNIIACTLVETRNVALGRIWHQESRSLFVRSLECSGRLRWCGKCHWHFLVQIHSWWWN